MSFWAQPLWLQSHTVRVAQRRRCVYLCPEKDLPLFHTALSSLYNHKQWERNILHIFKVLERGYNWTCDQPAGENAGFVALLNIVFVVHRISWKVFTEESSTRHQHISINISFFVDLISTKLPEIHVHTGKHVYAWGRITRSSTKFHIYSIHFLQNYFFKQMFLIVTMTSMENLEKQKFASISDQRCFDYNHVVVFRRPIMKKYLKLLKLRNPGSL